MTVESTRFHLRVAFRGGIYTLGRSPDTRIYVSPKGHSRRFGSHTRDSYSYLRIDPSSTSLTRNEMINRGFSTDA
jgi:hypothetical protein